ncbi:glycosyltransferase family 4 protein [Leptospira sp. 96542]|nr:glycosyltransferase family 4 protein [Leptospira sp. 96542]
MAKILIVTSRYLDTAVGGAEKLTKDYAELLSEINEVTVCTTTAKDYVTWKNQLLIGVSHSNSIKILRFTVLKERNIRKMNVILSECLDEGINVKPELEEKFLIEQGPYSPDLVDYVTAEQNKYDLIILIGYLYYPIVKLVPVLKVPFVIVPTFHDEPAFQLPLYKRTYLPKFVYSFNAPEELDVYLKYIGQTPKNYFLIGTYVELNEPNNKNSESIRKSQQLVSIGRIEPAKGYPELFEYYSDWKKNVPDPNIKLICIGSLFSMKPDPRDDIEFTGFLDEETKLKILSESAVLINPSPFESFSISIMEAWLSELPVLVNAKSLVMRGHCIRSQGGLYYNDSILFKRTLEYLLKDSKMRTQLGKNGKRYVELNFSKQMIREKLNQMVSTLLG